MAHRNRWFTELKNGDFPWQTVTNNQMVDLNWCKQTDGDILYYIMICTWHILAHVHVQWWPLWKRSKLYTWCVCWWCGYLAPAQVGIDFESFSARSQQRSSRSSRLQGQWLRHVKTSGSIGWGFNRFMMIYVWISDDFDMIQRWCVVVICLWEGFA